MFLIVDTQYKNTQHSSLMSHFYCYAESCYDECCYAECFGATGFDESALFVSKILYNIKSSQLELPLTCATKIYSCKKFAVNNPNSNEFLFYFSISF